MVSSSRFGAARTRLLRILFTSAVFLGAGEVSGASLTASWVDNSNGVATTRVERREGAVAFVAIADVPPRVTQYVDTSISAGTEYCYRVLAYTADGVSPYSEEACAVSSNQGGALNLTVSKAGNGAGTVTSTPAGILCGADCSESYVTGSSVTLIAVPAVGSTFAGWSGPGCDGFEPCTLAGQGPVTVTATFTAGFFVSPFPGRPSFPGPGPEPPGPEPPEPEPPGPEPPAPLFYMPPFLPWNVGSIVDGISGGKR